MQVQNRQLTPTPKDSILTLDELLKAENTIIRFCQQQRFRGDLHSVIKEGYCESEQLHIQVGRSFGGWIIES